MSTTQPQTLLQHLITDDVLKETPSGDIALSDSFQTERDQLLRLSNRELAEIGEQIHRQSEHKQAETVDSKFIKTVAVLNKLESGITLSDAIAAARMIRKIEVSERIDGVPSSFLSVGVGELPALLESNPAALVFCWRENSDPSAGLRDDLEQLCADGVIPEWFGLGAIYGPTNAAPLRNQYDVTVAPTLLFCIDDRIDCRLVGHHNIETTINEIEILADAAGPKN